MGFHFRDLEEELDREAQAKRDKRERAKFVKKLFMGNNKLRQEDLIELDKLVNPEDYDDFGDRNRFSW